MMLVSFLNVMGTGDMVVQFICCMEGLWCLVAATPFPDVEGLVKPLISQQIPPFQKRNPESYHFVENHTGSPINCQHKKII